MDREMGWLLEEYLRGRGWSRDGLALRKVIKMAGWSGDGQAIMAIGRIIKGEELVGRWAGYWKSN